MKRALLQRRHKTTMSDSAQGGDDEVTGGDNTGSGSVSNILVGDGSFMSDSAQGGDDELTGGNNSGSGSVSNLLRGDANGMSGFAQGSDDELTGGDNFGSGTVTNTLIGDASEMSGSAQGGDDRVISGINATDLMWGDAQLLLDSATGGKDTFVFVDAAFGQDFVNDFHQGEDTLEFQVAGVSDFDDLVIVLIDSDTVISTTASATDTVTLVGFSGTLTESDFLFS
jgi:hypothetical protein